MNAEKSRGYIKLSRKQFDKRDRLWDDGTPYDRRSAWTWLIQSAAWKDSTYRVAGGKVPLKRGEFVASIRFLAERFKWSKSSVSRFLQELSDRKSIASTPQIAGHLAGRVAGQPVGHLGRVYLIANYETYQGDAESVGQQPGQLVGQQPGQSRSSKAVEASNYSPEFELIWKVLPKKPGANKKQTHRLYLAHLKRGVDFDTMHNGALHYAAYATFRGWIGTNYVKAPQVFMGDDQHFLTDWTIPSEPSDIVGVGGIPSEAELRRAGIRLA